MEKYKESFIKLITNKRFLITLIMVAIASYGYTLTHVAVNIDVLSADKFMEGTELIAQHRLMGPIIERIFNIMDFYPFLGDFIAVIFLIISAILYCSLFDVISKGKIKNIAYTIFACFFISYPLIMEIFVFSPMGISIALGFCLIALSLMFIHEAFIDKKKSKFVIGTIALWCAISFYESFAVVYIVGVLSITILEILYANDEKLKVGKNIAKAFRYAIPLVIAFLFNLMITNLVLIIFNIEPSTAADKKIYYVWLGIKGGLRNVINTVMVDYVINALAYLPITFMIIGAMTSIIIGVTLSIKRKDISIFLFFLGIDISLLILSFIQGKATIYRTCQHFQLFVAFIFMIFVNLMLTINMKKSFKNVFLFVMFFMIFYQVKEIYKLQYINEIRYQHEKSDMTILAHELTSKYDVENKPVVFYGDYQLPECVKNEVYIKPNSLHYKVLKSYCEHFYQENLEKVGEYKCVQSAVDSYVKGATYGFFYEGVANVELMRLFKYLGYEFKTTTTDKIYFLYYATEGIDVPTWPKEGSILDLGEFIFVHF